MFPWTDANEKYFTNVNDDVKNRRQIWDLFQFDRANRSILRACVSPVRLCQSLNSKSRSSNKFLVIFYLIFNTIFDYV